MSGWNHSNKKRQTPINDKIVADEVMLINEDGTKRGLVTFHDAIESAKSKSLDLVQVSPDGSDVVVCKLLDYGKHLFDKKKNSSVQR